MVFPRLFTCPTLETTNFKVGQLLLFIYSGPYVYVFSNHSKNQTTHYTTQGQHAALDLELARGPFQSRKQNTDFSANNKHKSI